MDIVVDMCPINDKHLSILLFPFVRILFMDIDLGCLDYFLDLLEAFVSK